MTNRRYILTAIIALSVTIPAAGCAGVAVKEGTEDKGSVTVKTDGEKSVTLSGEKEIPKGFPTDIPLPAEIGVVSSLKRNDSYTVAIETKLSMDKVVKLYQEYAEKANYKEVFKMSEEGSYRYSGSKGNELFAFNLQLDLEDKKTVTGALVYEKKP
ncbi:MAG: hypothetical protein K0R28_655 [Paenibacillus sp.]|nr:hypothetical protein [Paenibacillus sp.]